MLKHLRFSGLHVLIWSRVSVSFENLFKISEILNLTDRIRFISLVLYDQTFFTLVLFISGIVFIVYSIDSICLWFRRIFIDFVDDFMHRGLCY